MGDITINGKNVITQSGSAEPVLASNVTGGAGLTLQYTNATFTTPTIDSIKLTPGTAPVSPAEGQMYYNDVDNVVKVYNGSTWDQLSNKFSATGGTESTYTSGGVTYKVHTFTSSGTFLTEASGSVDLLVVAGGASGANDHGGGGGAGGYRISTNHAVTTQGYSIVVGAGGASAPAVRGSVNTHGNAGTNSSALSITSIGGGGGGDYNYDAAGDSGGSGGGAGGNGVVGVGTAGQGNNGGTGTHGPNYQGGGGGGAGAVGTNSSGLYPNGGSGSSNSLRTGSNITYAGGGGGNGSYGGGGQYGSGGSGGGGNGANQSVIATAGTVNTGSGGGGGARYTTDAGGNQSGPSGAGGSGIVIIRYPI